MSLFNLLRSTSPLIFNASITFNSNGHVQHSEENGRRRCFLLFSLVTSGTFMALSASGKVKGKNPYDEKRLLEQNKKIQEANKAPDDFPNFIRKGFQVNVVTSDKYVKCDSGLIYLDTQVGQGDCPKAGQQVFPCIVFRSRLCFCDYCGGFDALLVEQISSINN